MTLYDFDARPIFVQTEVVNYGNGLLTDPRMPFFYDKDDLDAQPRGCSCFDRDGEQMKDLVMGSSPRLIESGYFEIPVLLSKIFPKWTRKVTTYFVVFFHE